MAKIRWASGWGPSANLAQGKIQNTTYCSRDTGTLSPRGGTASLKIVQTTNNIDAQMQCLFSTSSADAMVDATGGADWGMTAPGVCFTFDWYTGATPTGGDGNVVNIQLSGGTSMDVRLYWRKSDGKLELFKQTTAGAHSAGTTQATGSRVFSQNTWYRLWIWIDPSAGGTTNAFFVDVYYAEIDAMFFTRDISASVTNTSTTGGSFFLGGPTDATTAPGWTTYFANIHGMIDIADGEFRDVVVLKSTVSGESSTVNWNPSTGTTHYTLVDELPENGSGTTDSDWVAETVTDNEQFVMTSETPPVGYPMPIAVIQAYWHRNATGSKWATADNHYRWQCQGTAVTGGTPLDPGTSYTTGSMLRRRGATSGQPLVPEDIPSMEFGMSHGAGDTPDWRVSAVAGEIAWERIAAVGPVFM